MQSTTVAETPEQYIEGLEEPRRGHIRELHERIGGVAPELDPRIASGMLVYGSYHYRYATGREGDWYPIALASNKRYISLYIAAPAPDGSGYLAESYQERLPKADIGRSCVRFEKPDDVDDRAIEELIRGGAAVDGTTLTA